VIPHVGEAEDVPVCRRELERRFRRALGRTPRDQIVLSLDMATPQGAHFEAYANPAAKKVQNCQIVALRPRRTAAFLNFRSVGVNQFTAASPLAADSLLVGSPRKGYRREIQ